MQTRQSKILYALVCAAAIVLMAWAGVHMAVRGDPEDVALALRQRIDKVARPTIVTDRHGLKLGAFSEEARYPKKLKEIPLIVRQAFLAAEDAQFYKHHGVSWRGIFRSALVNLRRERVSQGGSTITQQLVRQYLLGRERTIQRKLREIVLSLRLEQQLSKDEILELWLNGVYLGNNAWGVEAAAQNYFHKTVGELNLGEAAVLAGLPQAPSRYAPHIHPKAARGRKHYVLNRMQKTGWITAKAAKRWSEQKVSVYRDRESMETSSPWVIESTRLELWQRLELQHLPRSGLTITTNIERDWQTQAQAMFSSELRPFQTAGLEASFIAIDLTSGAILTLVGGTDFERSQFNRATMLSRPFGSATYPLIYGWALDGGLSMAARGQSLAAAAVTNQFLDGDRAAASLGYGRLKEKFQDLGLVVKSEESIENVQGSPLSLALAWRLLSGRPLVQPRQLVRRIRDVDGREMDTPVARTVKAGMSDAAAFTVRSWLAHAKPQTLGPGVIRFSSDVAWNHWEIATTDSIVAVLWAGVDQRPSQDPDSFRKLQDRSRTVMDRWLKSTGNTIVRPTVATPPGLSWNALKRPNGKTEFLPFPTVLQ